MRSSWWLCVLLLGCTASAEPLLTVDLRTDYAPGTQFQAVLTEVVAYGGSEWEGPRTAENELTVASNTATLPSLRTAAFLAGLATGEDYRVRVSLLNAEGEAVASQVRRLNVREPSHGLMFVLASACAGETCAEGEVCVDVRGCIAEAEACLGRFSDPGACEAEPECSDEDPCTDALWCQSASCVAGSCLYPTDPAACTDGMFCRADAVGSAFCDAGPDAPLVAPVPRAPASGEMVGSPLGEGASPKLVWTGSFGASYVVQVDACDPLCFETDSPTFEAPVEGADFLRLPAGSPLSAGQYAWRVRALHDDQESGWSEERRFWVADRHAIGVDDAADIAVAFLGSPDEVGTGGNVGVIYVDSGEGMLLFEDSRSGGFGAAIDVGDVTGDGVADLIGGAPLFVGDQNHEGHGWVESGWDGSSFRTSPELYPPDPMPEGHFGEALAWLADVTLDGLGDLAVGEPGPEPPVINAGRVHVFVGGPDIGMTPPLTIESPDRGQAGRFGAALEGCDVTGDAVTDLVVGAPFGGMQGRGAVYVFHDLTGAEAVLFERIDAPEGAVEFGATLRCAPDLNGDGNPELLIGAPQSNLGVGAAYVRFGRNGDPGNPVLVALPLGDTTGLTRLGESLSALPGVSDVDIPARVVVGSSQSFGVTVQSRDWSFERSADAWVFVDPPPSTSRFSYAAGCLSLAGARGLVAGDELSMSASFLSSEGLGLTRTQRGAEGFGRTCR